MKPLSTIAALGIAAVLCAIVPTTASAVSVIDIDAGGSIPPSSTSGTSVFEFTVSGEDAIADLDVRLSIKHTFVMDLIATLSSPLGTSVELFNRIDAGHDNFQDTWFDDEAATAIDDGSPPYAGPEWGGVRYRLESDFLSAFDGENPNGTWTLTVDDVATGDYGRLYKAGETAPWGTAIGTQLMLTPVPEPVTMAGLFLGIGCLSRYVRKRRGA